jgi:guanylate kinase
LTAIQVRSQNKICILDIDIQGVQTVKKSKLDCKTLFIMPPSIKDLEERLKGRGTESMEKIKVRLENAVGEIAFAKGEGNFDKVIVNDDVNKTFTEVVTTLQNWFPELDLYLKEN